MKYRLARELIEGEWYVEFKVDGKPTRFHLVSEKDLEEVKRELNLPDSAFTYRKLELDGTE